jgi:hypothetical protein
VAASRARRHADTAPLSPNATSSITVSAKKDAPDSREIQTPCSSVSRTTRPRDGCTTAGQQEASLRSPLRPVTPTRSPPHVQVDVAEGGNGTISKRDSTEEAGRLAHSQGLARPSRWPRFARPNVSPVRRHPLVRGMWCRNYPSPTPTTWRASKTSSPPGAPTSATPSALAHNERDGTPALVSEIEVHQ